MADKVAGLLFKIAADTRALQQGFSQVQKKTSVLKKAFSTLGPAILAAFSVRAVSNFLKSVTQLYNVQAKAEASLLTALGGREDIQKRLIKQARELQGITLYGDEQTIAAQSMLAQMGLEEAAIKKLIPLTQDFATAKGMDLKAAADLVAKSLGSSTNALTRYGITITGAVGSSERLDTAVTNLTKAFGGQAEAAALAGTGGITQLKNAVDDVKEALGKALLETGNFNEKASELAKTLSSIDWEKTFDGMIKGTNNFRDALALTNPLIGQFILLQEGLLKLLPKKPIGGATGSAGVNINDLIKPKTTTAGFKKAASLSKVSSIQGSVQSDPGLFGKMSKISGIGAGQFDLSGMISGVEQRTSKLATTVRTTLAPAMAELGIVVQQVFAGAVEAFGSFVEQLASGNLDMSLQTILASFGGFIAQMGKMIAAYGFAALAMKAVLVNPVAAIAAGLAMVAIGSAIKGLASRGPAVGGGGGGAPGGGMAAIPITGTTKIQGRDIVIAYERGSSLTNSVT